MGSPPVFLFIWVCCKVCQILHHLCEGIPLEVDESASNPPTLANSLVYDTLPMPTPTAEVGDYMQAHITVRNQQNGPVNLLVLCLANAFSALRRYTPKGYTGFFIQCFLAPVFFLPGGFSPVGYFPDGF